jgi:hypothetical protein
MIVNKSVNILEEKSILKNKSVVAGLQRPGSNVKTP